MMERTFYLLLFISACPLGRKMYSTKYCIVKVLDEYSSNISLCISVQQWNSSSWNHDCHVAIEQRLLLALRCSLLVKTVCSSVVELRSVYIELCSQNYWVENFHNLAKNIAITLYQLEIIFPPSFFHVTVYVPYMLP